MRKYRVTEKHEGYKEGIMIHYNNTVLTRFKLYRSDDITHLWDENGCMYTIETWIKNDWIVEIQEPEFTRDEVIGIICNLTAQSYTEAEIDIDHWIKRNKKQ